jgi:hypothetical protein
MVFPALGKNSAKIKEPEQAFVGLPGNACLARRPVPERCRRQDQFLGGPRLSGFPGNRILTFLVKFQKNSIC